MPPDRRDMSYLYDILDTARAAVGFLEERRFEDLLSDRMLRSAIERSIEIVGEAARRLSQETRDGLPDIPWKAMIGLRNVLAHEYDEIRYEIIWKVCKTDLPALVSRLEAFGVDRPPVAE